MHDSGRRLLVVLQRDAAVAARRDGAACRGTECPGSRACPPSTPTFVRLIVIFIGNEMLPLWTVPFHLPLTLLAAWAGVARARVARTARGRMRGESCVASTRIVRISLLCAPRRAATLAVDEDDAQGCDQAGRRARDAARARRAGGAGGGRARRGALGAPAAGLPLAARGAAGQRGRPVPPPRRERGDRALRRLVRGAGRGDPGARRRRARPPRRARAAARRRPRARPALAARLGRREGEPGRGRGRAQRRRRRRRRARRAGDRAPAGRGRRASRSRCWSEAEPCRSRCAR